MAKASAVEDKSPVKPTAEWVQQLDAEGLPTGKSVCRVTDASGTRDLSKGDVMRAIYNARAKAASEGQTADACDAANAHLVDAHNGAPADALLAETDAS